MGFGTNGLTFNTLRGANMARLPQFKNKHGVVAHTRPDGSDWSPAQWMQALMGEVGELATVRMNYEAGNITFSQYKILAEKEVADVQTYLDLLSLRLLDTLTSWRDADVPPGQPDKIVPGGYPFENSPAQLFMRLVANLGEYANIRKKRDRGDINQMEYEAQSGDHMKAAFSSLKELSMYHAMAPHHPHPGDVVEKAHKQGVNLGEATMSKFNEVSERVKSNIFMDADDWHYRNPPPEEERRK